MSISLASLQGFVLRSRRPLVVAIHMVLIVAANFMAFWLRFDGVIDAEHMQLFLETLPWLIFIRGLTFIPFRLYEGLWRYTGIWDLRSIIFGVVISSMIFATVMRWGFGLVAYPRSIFILDAILLIVLMGGVRLFRRLFLGLIARSPTKRLLIYGAGDAGELIARDITNNSQRYDCRLVGFVDDDENKIGQRIHGVKVLGSRKDIADIVTAAKPDEILIAISGSGGALLRDLVRALESFKIPIKTLPNLNGHGNGTLTLSQMRDVSFEDLLDRASVGLELEIVRQWITGKRVLVTGAGGSIGSELCRQIAHYGPEMLVMLEKSENALYAIDMELCRTTPALIRMPVLGDVKHLSTLQDLFSRFHPQIVFHAAAYKHVPMMEHYPKEAVLNNITGTYRLTQVALEYKVERFILISTDKAVNPTNVMGATKRVGEMYLQALAREGRQGGTIFSAVRFGNVLGSNGSVVPLFLQQIQQGGPVTITHPEVARYFMTIPEAVQLVLRAATLATGGEIFVLEMGEQIKVVNMARQLIRICGYVPEKDIPISFIGLRPGEKLTEELVGPDETKESSPTDKIFVVRSAGLPPLGLIVDRILKLERAAIEDKLEKLLHILGELVPTFRPVDAQLGEGFELGDVAKKPVAAARAAIRRA
ncbi:MAG TPA: nucleoside-diphosphate sugar epimerase/dehydratase [Candidatus Eisenbacteria bacterium]|nr:nucleoside-diphosphate sugar epimerase/dehydratase [Candidatus Eisenbacteria bacterium]